MAGIIKKQILKHLSRFTKNLSPDKINLSTLKGQGQLTNLELDEEVLQNVLDLPTWLAITRVFCNKASMRYLDKVEVEMRTCEEPRPPNGQSPIALASGQSEYGFAEKVVEGMFIVVNSITIKIHSRAFHASFELWQLQGYSVNPNWQQSDLRFTRITDSHRGEVLTFKELTWQSLRIEADATDNGDQDPITTPLRLITNQGRIQISLKRKTKDCNVMASKLMFLLDDLLWVLTDSQLKAMMKYAESLSEAMEKSAQQRKSLAPEPILITPPAPSTQHSWSQSFGSSHKAISQYFEKHDMKESSYHLLISRLDLHICDDSHTRETGASKHGITGGAMQLTFRRMAFDYYPFHWAGDSCKHWVQYCDAMETREQWAKKLVDEFQLKMEKCGEATRSGVAGKESPFRMRPDTISSSQKSSPEKGVPQANTPPPSLPKCQRPAWNRLRSSCVVIRVDDLDIHQVSTAGQHSKKPSTLLSCKRKSLNLPDQTSAIHIEFTEYYLPDNPDFPVPCPNLYLQLNGLTFTLDTVSMLWVNLFCLDLYRSLQQFKAIYKLENSSRRDEHFDARLDGFMLKVSHRWYRNYVGVKGSIVTLDCSLSFHMYQSTVISPTGDIRKDLWMLGMDSFIDEEIAKLNIPVEKKVVEHRDRPHCLSIRTSKMTATNTRHTPPSSCSALQNLFRRFANSEFYHASYTQFPRFQDNFSLLHTVFLHHAYLMDAKAQKGVDFHHFQQRSSIFEDLWSVNFTEIFLDFEETKSLKGKPFSFINPFPLCVWACLPKKWEEIQSTKLQVSSVSPVQIKSSASFSNHAKHQDHSKEEHFRQRSKTEQNLKSISSTSEATETFKEGTVSVNDETEDKDVEVSADIHVLLYSSEHVKVRLNHYQYLMLLRMKEVLLTFQEQLTQDTKEVIGSPLDSITTCMGVMFNSAEVALLMHPVPSSASEHRSGNSDTTSLIESEISHADSREGLAGEVRELKLDDGLEKRNGSPTKVLEDSGIENTDMRMTVLQDGMLKSQNDGSMAEGEFNSQTAGDRGTVEEAHEAEETLGAEKQNDIDVLPQVPHVLPSSPSSILDPLGGIHVSLNGQEELIPLKNVEAELSSALHITKDATKEALHATMDLTKEAMSMTKDAFSLSKEKMASTMQKMLFHPSTKDHGSKTEEGLLTPAGSGSGRMRFFSMRRTVSQHSFDTSSLDGSSIEDRLSVDSDGSEGFVMLIESDPTLELFAPGQLPQALDDAGTRTSPVVEEEKESTYISSSISQSKEDSSPQLVSVLLLKVNEINCVIETKGEDMSLALQAMEIIPEALGNTSMWHYLQSDLTGDPHSERSSTETNQTQPQVRLRFEIGPSAAVHSPLAVQNGFFHILIHSYHAELLTSSVSGLGLFLEDEVIPEVIPMKIELIDTKIILKDDTPRVYPTSPGPIPLMIAMDHIVVCCNDEGVFVITAAQGGEVSTRKRPQEDHNKQHIPAERTYVVSAGANEEQELKEVPALERELQVTKRALAEANLDKERLLEEIKKYDPLFQL